MQDNINIPQDRDLTTLFTLGVPAAVVVALFFEIKGPQANVWALTAYAAFLGTYLCWVFGYEYAVCGELHSLKSRPADTIVVAAVFGGILQVSRTAGDVEKTLLWLTLFLIALTVWETYTMVAGYRRYFGRGIAGSGITVLDLARRAVPEDAGEDRGWHWNEYRYWMLLDGTLCIVVATAWTLSGRLEKALSVGGINLAIAALGFTIGAVNIWRYAQLVRDFREHRPPE